MLAAYELTAALIGKRSRVSGALLRTHLHFVCVIYLCESFVYCLRLGLSAAHNGAQLEQGRKGGRAATSCDK